MLGINLIGKLKRTPREHSYIFTCTDYFTKWVEAFPIRSKKADCVAQCLVNIFFRHGAPKKVLSDRGREFVNQVSKSIYPNFL